MEICGDSIRLVDEKVSITGYLAGEGTAAAKVGDKCSFVFCSETCGLDFISAKKEINQGLKKIDL